MIGIPYAETRIKVFSSDIGVLSYCDEYIGIGYLQPLWHENKKVNLV